ncbi:MAG: hypothetical protein AB7J28_15325 [Hyphomonadaceae bacterium]
MPIAIVEKAKTEASAFKNRMQRAWNAIVGARVTVAVMAMFAMAFGITILIAPFRLPPIGGLSLAQVGLPDLQLGAEKQIAGDIVGAADRQGGAQVVRQFFDAHPELIPIANWTGLGLAVLFLVLAIAIQIRQFRRGVEPL